MFGCKATASNGVEDCYYSKDLCSTWTPFYYVSLVIKTVSVSCIYAFLSLYWCFLTVVCVSIRSLNKFQLIKERISVNIGRNSSMKKLAIKFHRSYLGMTKVVQGRVSLGSRRKFLINGLCRVHRVRNILKINPIKPVYKHINLFITM